MISVLSLVNTDSIWWDKLLLSPAELSEMVDIWSLGSPHPDCQQVDKFHFPCFNDSDCWRSKPEGNIAFTLDKNVWSLADIIQFCFVFAFS